MIFTRNGEGNYSNLWSNSVKPNVNERTHKLSTTHFVVCTQSFNSSRNWLGHLMHWEWRGMVVNFVLGQAINMGNHIFSFGARKHPEMCAQTIPHPWFSLPHVVGASWGVFFTFFCNFLHFSMAGKSIFVLHNEWEE